MFLYSSVRLGTYFDEISNKVKFTNMPDIFPPYNKNVIKSL